MGTISVNWCLGDRGDKEGVDRERRGEWTVRTFLRGGLKRKGGGQQSCPRISIREKKSKKGGRGGGGGDGQSVTGTGEEDLAGNYDGGSEQISFRVARRQKTRIKTRKGKKMEIWYLEKMDNESEGMSWTENTIRGRSKKGVAEELGGRGGEVLSLD